MIPLEEVCIGHITPRRENCRVCKLDEGNKYCPNYKTRTEVIQEKQPYLLPKYLVETPTSA
jgi:hypothetical protein